MSTPLVVATMPEPQLLPSHTDIHTSSSALRAARAMRLLPASAATTVAYSSLVAVMPTGADTVPSAPQALPSQTRY